MQKLAFILFFLSVVTIGKDKRVPINQETIPAGLKGNFMDDYGIKYTINDTLWVQHPRTRYHIIKWNVKEQYLVARNDGTNPGEGGYTPG